MASNVYTKNEILQSLASKGYFIDSYTLDTFFKKWQVEAIFEDEQGSEFYDKNTLDLVLSNLFNLENKEENKETETTENKEEKQEENNTIQENIVGNEDVKQNTKASTDIIQKPKEESKIEIEDSETNQILNNISLSDGTPLIDKMQDTIPIDDLIENEPVIELNEQPQPSVSNEKKMGILEGALKTDENETPPIIPSMEIIPNDNNNNNGDFDDISLLSESLEAQEKFREYVVSELTKKNVDLTPKNEFKLDISERTLSMIARSMAKKIAKHVSSICSQDAKAQAKLADIQEENKKLEQKARFLEEQNRKLKLLLAESNKNLNSYKPSIFGLYKKVPPKKQ